jgi:RNA polymerase sigma-70 factor (ECF subfamily)
MKMAAHASALVHESTPTGHVGGTDGEAHDFGPVYDENFEFVWRAARRLGVHPAALDDVVQEVFLVVHRRLPEQDRSYPLRNWLYAIVVRIVRANRRKAHHRAAELPTDAIDTTRAHPSARPDEGAARAEAIATLYAILDQLDDDKREVFVLAELEELTAPQIAAALEVNVNTVYARLRAARHAFNEAVARYKARDQWRLP